MRGLFSKNRSIAYSIISTSCYGLIVSTTPLLVASNVNASTIIVGETGKTATITTDVPLPSDFGKFMSGKVTAQCDENDGGFDCAAEKDAVSVELDVNRLKISFNYAVDGPDTTDNDHDFGTTTFSGSISYTPNTGGKAESVSFGNVNVVVTDEPVPEPSTWAMMLLGFAGLGFAVYRRTRVAVSAA